MNTSLTRPDRMLGGLWGSLTGDALGVPVEFKSRAEISLNPVAGMRAYGTHGQPAGTWSDDSSLLLCSVESLVEEEFSLEDMSRRFVQWAHASHWTPHGVVFDIGIATSRAIRQMSEGVPPLQCGGRTEHDNGNGSLMRIIPVCLRFAGEEPEVMLRRIEEASSITHAHPRTLIACGFFGLFVRELLAGMSPPEALRSARKEFIQQYSSRWPQEMPDFSPLDELLALSPAERIGSSGYVLDTLTASIWCLLTTETFSECVLKAVNLGSDTDTTGCVAGGLAGVYYGLEAIPAEWLAILARKVDVSRLFNRFVS